MMSDNLIITIIAISCILFLIVTIVLKRGRIPEKYALLWYFMIAILLLVAIIPGVFSYIASKLGFYPMSNFIIGIFIGVLILLTMALTVMMAGQKKKTTLLIQEISLLKEEVKKQKK
ncbi:MAG: DUF2304 domain-containing protein [Bacilli bacterium]|nr:DUF2304 domain-containing protein [Bacilli bacterium]